MKMAANFLLGPWRRFLLWIIKGNIAKLLMIPLDYLSTCFYFMLSTLFDYYKTYHSITNYDVNLNILNTHAGFVL
jgi:hypothetical protein